MKDDDQDKTAWNTQAVQLAVWPGENSGMERYFPPVIARADDAGHHRFQMEITPELAWFHGHFPGNPILPGVVQLHWAVLLSQSIFGFSEDPVEIKQLKFKSVVTPGRILELALTRQSDRLVEFGYSSLDLKHSQGRLVFDEASAC